ncbi:hypothetical protein QZH41_016346, partial [Actinostola sp. cb2023]
IRIFGYSAEGKRRVRMPVFMLSVLASCGLPVTPVAVFPFDEEYGGEEAINHEIQATLTGVDKTTGPNGEKNGGLMLRGNSESYIEIPNTDRGKLDISKSITILAFIRPITADLGPILNYKPDGHGVQIWTNGRDNGKGILTVRFNKRNLALSQFVSKNVLNLKEWNFIGASYDYDTEMASLWHDGRKVLSTKLRSPHQLELATQFPIRLGTLTTSGLGAFEGVIACLQLYSTVLTQAQIEAAREACASASPVTSVTVDVLPPSMVPEVNQTVSLTGFTQYGGKDGIFTFNFGDGNSTVAGSPNTAVHTYRTAGEYVIAVIVTDRCKLGTPIQKDLKVTVTHIITKLHGLTLIVHPSTPGHDANVTLAFPDVSSFNCSVEFGDGRRYFISNPPFRPIKTSVVTHRYTTDGLYNVLANCWNRINTCNATAVISVQYRIQGLKVVPIMISKNGTDIVVIWRATEGSNVEYQARVNGDTEISVSKSNDTKEGRATITPKDYGSVGRHSVTITASNDVTAPFNVTREFEVMYPVLPFTVALLNTTGYFMVKKPMNLSIDAIAHGQYGSPLYRIDFGDGSPHVVTNGSVVTHTYIRHGCYVVNVTGFNGVSNLTVSKPVCIEREMELLKELTVFSTPAKVDENVIILLNLNNGSHFRCTVYFSDGVALPTGQKQTLEVRVNRSFDKPGIYDVIARCWNKVSRTASTTTITIQHIIEGFVLYSITPVTFGQNITVKWSVTQGTNVTYNVTFMSRNIEYITGGSVNTSVITADKYNDEGLYSVTVTAVNRVTQTVTLKEQFVIEKLIYGVDMKLRYVMNDVEHDGIGKMKTYFPLGFPVVIRTNLISQSMHVHYSYRLDGVTMETWQNKKIFNLPALNAGIHNVSVTAVNNVSGVNHTTQFLLQEKVKFRDRTLLCTTQVVIGDRARIRFSVGSVASDACLIVYLMNDTIYHYGNADCDQFTNNTSSVSRVHIQSIPPYIDFYHIFINAGLNLVRVQLVNLVSKDTITCDVNVLLIACTHPTVTLQQIGLDRTKARVVKRSESLDVYSETNVFCPASESTVFDWRIYKIHKTTDKSQFLNNTGRSQGSSLRIEKRSLWFGLYRVSLTVRMPEPWLQEYSSEASGYVEVIPSDLVAKIEGGTSLRRGMGPDVKIDGSSSYDPDVGPKNLTGMTFLWLCRKASASFPKQYINLKSSFSVSDLLSAKVDTSGACYANQPYIVQNNAPKILLTTSKLAIEKYVVQLVIRKGDRVSTTEQTIEIVKGEPPSIDIICAENCREKVNPSERLSLSAECNGAGCWGKLFYDWTMYILTEGNTWTVATYNSSQATSKPGSRITIIGKNTLEGGRQYKIEVTAKRQIGPKGLATAVFHVNSPPFGGKCEVSPRVGHVLMTKFHFRCRDWKDPDEPLSYQFLFASEGSEQTLLYYGAKAEIHEGLPLGAAASNYTLNIEIRIADRLGAKTNTFLSVESRPPHQDSTQVMEEISSMTSGNNSVLDSLRKSGQPQAVTLTISTISSLLNTNDTKGNDDAELQIKTQVNIIIIIITIIIITWIIINFIAFNIINFFTIINSIIITSIIIINFISPSTSSPYHQYHHHQHHHHQLDRLQHHHHITSIIITSIIITSIIINLIAFSIITISPASSSPASSTSSPSTSSPYHQHHHHQHHHHQLDCLQQHQLLHYHHQHHHITSITNIIITSIIIINLIAFSIINFFTITTSITNIIITSIIIINLIAFSIINFFTITTSITISPASPTSSSPASSSSTSSPSSSSTLSPYHQHHQLQLVFFSQVRGKMIESLSEIKSTNLESLGQVTSAMSQATKVRHEINPQAQVTSANTLSNVGQMLGSQDDSDVGFDSIKSNADSYFSALDNVLGMVSSTAGTKQIVSTSPNSTAPTISEAETIKAKDSTKSLIGSMSSVAKSLLKRKLPQEQATTFVTPGMRANLKRASLEDMDDDDLSLGSEGKFIASIGEDLMKMKLADNKTSLDQEAFTFKDNIYSWDKTSSDVTSPVLSLSYSVNGKALDINGLSKPIQFIMKRNQALPEPQTFELRITESAMNYHKIVVPTNDDSLSIEVFPLNCSYMLNVTVRRGSRPTFEEYSWIKTIQSGNGTQNSSQCLYSEDDTVLFLSNKNLSSGVYFVGITTNGTDPTPNATLQYSMRIYASKCLYWSEKAEKWTGDGCTGGPLTNSTHIQCLTTHLTSFGTGMFVAPNPIDFSRVFAGFKEAFKTGNVVVLFTVLGLYLIYALLAVWARRTDNKDAGEMTSILLPQFKETFTYTYELTIVTGSRRYAGTKANVFCDIHGETTSTGSYPLLVPKRKGFPRRSIRTFIMSTPGSMGPITGIRIWHDCAGKDSSWFLRKILLRDPQTNEEWLFAADMWLGLDVGDGEVETFVKPNTLEDLSEFNVLFNDKIRKEICDKHIWFSLILRPQWSPFTRLQRLSCCLSFLFTTMIASAMFYGAGPEPGDTAGNFQVGPLTMNMRTLMIAIQSAFVVVPVNVVIVACFRFSKPMPEREEVEEKKFKRCASSCTRPCRDDTEHDFDDEATMSEKERNGDLTKVTKHTGGIKEEPQMNENPKPESAPQSEEAQDAELENTTQEILQDKEDSEEKDELPMNENPITESTSQSEDVQEAEEDEEEEEDEKDHKKCKCCSKCSGFRFPYWFIYVGWFLCFSASFLSGLFAIFYSMMWGKEKSNQWLATMCLSFVQDILVSQPIKVVITALLFALIVQTIPLESQPDYNDQSYEDEVAPLDKSIVKKLRKQREKIDEIKGVMVDICYYIVILIIVSILGKEYRSPYTYHIKRTMKMIFENPAAGLDRISTAEVILIYRLCSKVTVTFETPSYGGVLTSVRVVSFQMPPASQSLMTGIVEGIAFILLSVMIFRVIMTVFHQRWKFFTRLSNLFDFVFVLVAVLVVLLRLVMTNTQAAQRSYYLESPSSYIDFHKCAGLSEIMNSAFAFMFFIAVARFGAFITLFSCIQEFTCTVKKSLEQLGNFILILVLLIISYSSFFVLAFADQLADFKNFSVATRTLFSFILSNLSGRELPEPKVLALPVITTYSLAMIFLMLNIFRAILGENHKMARELARREKEKNNF